MCKVLFNIAFVFQHFLLSFSTGSLCSDETLNLRDIMTIDNGTLKSFFPLLVICEGSFSTDEKAIQISRMRQRKENSHRNSSPFPSGFFFAKRKENFPADELIVELTIDCFYPLSHCECLNSRHAADWEFPSLLLSPGRL
jgi:hypothetical protein